MVTDQQVRRLFKLSNTEETQEIAASKAGMDVKTARKYLRVRRLPGEMKVERHWRTRKDAFEDVWPGSARATEHKSGAGSTDTIRRSAEAVPGAVCRRAVANITAKSKAL